MQDHLFDDKNLVIFSILVLGICVIFAPSLTPAAAEIVQSFGTGLFGIAVGRATK